MKIFKNQTILTSFIVAILIATFVALVFNLGGFFTSIFAELVLPKDATFTLWKFLILIFFGVASGYLAEKNSLKRILPYTLGFLSIWFVASVIANKFFNFSLVFIPICLTVLLTILAIHIKKLWLIDSEFTQKLVALASTGHLLEGKPADLRIESGLKLLETVLPLSEAIVFRYEIDGTLNPVGRKQNGKTSGDAVARHSSWRENVGLCEQSLAQRQTLVQTDDSEKGAARAALPLIHEGIAVGVLFVKVDQDFEREDKFLLEAFSGQLARNFQRKELREKSLPHQYWWSSFSTYSAESPEWMGKIGLEWLFRLTQEPKRLWRRYLILNPRFVWLAMLQLLKLKKFNN